MKITEFKTWAVENPPPSFGGPYFIFVKLVTDDGIVGYGEVYGVPFSPSVVQQMLADICERNVVGMDPHHIEKLWYTVYSNGYTQHPDLSVMGLLSAIEMACWDIIGKAADKPIYELLGGQVHEKIRSYTYLYPKEGDTVDVYINAELAPERAAEYAAEGFTAVKFDPVSPYTSFDPRQLSLEELSRAESYVKNVREAVGDEVDLLFGTHGQTSTSSAIRLAKRLEPYDPLWFEEPCPPANVKEMARIAQHTSIPVATGERLATVHDFVKVLEAQAASIIQMQIGRVGGLLQAKKIASMAEAHYAQIAPHLYCGPIIGAANIQLATCTPNFLILESIYKFDGFHADILKDPVQWENGYVIPSKKAGLGVELDEAVADANPYTGTKLHINPIETALQNGPLN